MKGLIIGVGVLVAIMIVVFSAIGKLNTENALRQTIVAKQLDNQSEYDNMWKKISQVAQVTMSQKEALKEIILGHAQARSGTGDKGAIMSWIQESVPNIDTSTFNNLQNIIVSSRDRFTMRQKELLDLSREHNTMLGKIPWGSLLRAMGRNEIDITIVTSSRTEESFRSGKDDNVNVF
jgi:hypothetical protein